MSLAASSVGGTKQLSGPSGSSVHFTYSREDAELLRQATNVVTRAGYQPTVELWGQGSAWFETWRKQLFEADGVVVLFTTGDEGGEDQKLGNRGMGYKEKLTKRFEQDGKDAALFRDCLLYTSPSPRD